MSKTIQISIIQNMIKPLSPLPPPAPLAPHHIYIAMQYTKKPGNIILVNSSSHQFSECIWDKWYCAYLTLFLNPFPFLQFDFGYLNYTSWW